VSDNGIAGAALKAFRANLIFFALLSGTRYLEAIIETFQYQICRSLTMFQRLY
jgi:hypothetical protein